MPLDLHVFRTLSDNAGALLRDRSTGACAAIDVPDADAVLVAAREKGWEISEIWITHAHADHVQGVAALKRATNARVTGPSDMGPGLDRAVGEGDEVVLGEARFQVWHTPGHQNGHLSFVSEAEKLALVGDVVFVMGCGRAQPGQVEALFGSVSRVAALADDVRVLGGHDYTLANARFARSVDRDNDALARRAAAAEAARERGEFLALTTVGEERATNPFFRARERGLAEAVGRGGGSEGEVFAALRDAKNRF